jgi:uncharacterized membrane protein YgcG
MTYIEQLNRLTRQYNDAIRALESSFDMESSQQGWGIVNRPLTMQYSRKYQALAQEYGQKRHQLFTAYERSNPQWAKWRRFWSKVFVAGIVALMGGCITQLPYEEAESASPSTNVRQLQNTDQVWSAENIPIPFLQDSTQYVSNPDLVLTQQTVDRMNVTLKRLDNELGVESIVIVVNHIENDDPFRMAQDVGNKYGVGRGDRGLIVVVGYQDHSINISPGRALEADLTDAECHRLEQRYVVPAMRADMPDSAMIYLTEAVYSTLQKKEMPVMSRLTSSEDETDDQIAFAIGITLLLFVLWCAFYLHLNNKYHWLGLLGTVSLLSNPFIIQESSHYHGGGFGGFGGGGSFGGGGGFSGGSFGGGSFGGGGATSRW